MWAANLWSVSFLPELVKFCDKIHLSLENWISLLAPKAREASFRVIYIFGSMQQVTVMRLRVSVLKLVTVMRVRVLTFVQVKFYYYYWLATGGQHTCPNFDSAVGAFFDSNLLLFLLMIFHYISMVRSSYNHYQLIHWLAIGGQHTCPNFGGASLDPMHAKWLCLFLTSPQSRKMKFICKKNCWGCTFCIIIKLIQYNHIVYFLEKSKEKI